jgi:catecholate siderophore receptor
MEKRMAPIRSKKKSTITLPGLNPTLLALAALAAPLAGHAQQASVVLPEVNVRADAEVPFKAEVSANPKLTQPLVDTPQTITIIKKELLQQQGAINLIEALRNTPGITVQLGENGNTAAGDTFQFRGVAGQNSVFVDGIRDLGAVVRDVYNIEQIEVIKGPAGTDTGRGASAGYVNLITKLPTKDNFSNATLSIDTTAQKRTAADLNRQIGENGAFRLNAMALDGDVIGRDVVKERAYAIAPSLAFGLGTPTRVYFYTQHVRRDNVPDGGIPAVGRAGFLSNNPAIAAAAPVNTENFYGSVQDNEKIDADMATAKIEHDLGGGTVLRNITRYGKSDIDRILTGVGSGTGVTIASNPANSEVTRNRQALVQENKILANQTNVTTEIKSGMLEHSLAAGFELMSEKQSSVGFTAPASVPNANLYHPNPNVSLPLPTRSGTLTEGETITQAIYGSDTIKVGKRWQFSGGLRYEHYKTTTDTIAPTGVTTLRKSGNLLSTRLAALYKPSANGSIYAAYGNAKTPPGSTNFTLSAQATNVNTPALKPQTAINTEIGTKWDVLNKKLGLTAAVFRTDLKDEVAVVDTVNNTVDQFGKRRVQGIELGAVGQINPKWDISAGLAFMSTKIITGSTGNNAAGVSTRFSPERTATIFTTYKWTPDWTVGGGARYVSKQKRLVDPAFVLAANTGVPEIPAYTVVDALVGYQLAKNVSLQLNIYNLFDKFYINSLNNGGNRITVGDERSALLSANLQF